VSDFTENYVIYATLSPVSHV